MRALTPQAVTVADRLLLLCGDEVVLVGGAGAHEARARVSGHEAAAAAAAPELDASWTGVFTWARHTSEERVGLQWAVTRDGRFRKRQVAGTPPEAIRVISPTAWHGAARRAERLYLLDRERARCVVWDAGRVTCVAYRTVLGGTYGAPADAFALRAGGRVVVGNARHNSGGTLLRVRPEPALDASNSTGVQVHDGDAVEVVEVSRAPHEWAKVSKHEVGAGWVAAANLHVQAHAAPLGGGGSMPHVPGIGALSVPRPPEWGGAAQAQNLQLVALEPGSERWEAVAGKLRASIPSARLVRIEQVQNVLLWTRHCVERQLMAGVHGAAPTELELWHGTRTTPTSAIFNGAEGFDMRFSKQGVWGMASYFAELAACTTPADRTRDRPALPALVLN